MNLQKAIEINEAYLRGDEPDIASDLPDAIRLGIETLKFRQRWEDQEGEDDFPLLPGETKD